jgi:hypothetical protein
MSKIALQGNISGTGTLTIAAPNTNTDRTLTLPDATGAVVLADAAQTLTNKSIAASQLTGALPAISGAALTSLPAPSSLTTASGSAPSYSARAWVKFNGFNGSIAASGNVSSVTYNGTGQSTVNFATAMQDANYSAVCSAHSAGFGRQSNAFPLYNGYSAGSVIIWYGNTVNAAAENMDVVNVAVFR